MSEFHLLDGKQRSAVEATEVAIAVLAGPGSGKTRVLSFRARHLLLSDPTSRALLLTFTNKAAAEMKSRARDVSAVHSRRLTACTFHTFGVEILRNHGTLVGIQPDFEILDEAEATDLQNSIAEGRYLNHGRPWGRSRLSRTDPVAQVNTFGKLYESCKRREGVVDFDDLVVYTAKLFEERQDIAQAYGARYPYILIDEFQDTNAVQFAIIEALAPHAKKISVFADDDQAIYGFAGADLAHIRRFVEKLRAKQYHLTTNYRCRSEIVTRANHLLDADPSASSRRMKAFHKGGEALAMHFTHTQQEAKWIASDIETILRSGTPAETISVLVRNRSRARDTLDELLSRDLPVSDWLGDRYPSRERRLLRTCLAVIRPELSDRQRRNLCELFELSASGERDTERFLMANTGHPGVSELMAVSKMPGTTATVMEILGAVQSCLDRLDSALPESLSVIVDSVRAFEEHDSEFTLDHLLSELALGGTGGAPTKGGGIKVATLHRTKGLQWPTVYLIGLEAGHLPDYRETSARDIAAERRVCFVGVCRAELRLVLTRVTTHRGFPKQPSLFLREMGFSA